MFPVLRLDTLYHIGTLNPLDLGRNAGRHSLEGHHLSVSLCPNAWRQIAKLGGYPLHRLQRTDSVFLDVLALTPDTLHTILSWACVQGLITAQTAWRAYYDEDGSYFWCDTEDEAREEAEDVAEYPIWRATAALALQTGCQVDVCQEATPWAIMAWAMAQGLDGVWWREDYDLCNHSAPRGCVFSDQVPFWAASPCSPPADERLLDAMPDISWTDLP